MKHLGSGPRIKLRMFGRLGTPNPVTNVGIYTGSSRTPAWPHMCLRVKLILPLTKLHLVICLRTSVCIKHNGLPWYVVRVAATFPGKWITQLLFRTLTKRFFANPLPNPNQLKDCPDVCEVPTQLKCSGHYDPSTQILPPCALMNLAKLGWVP